MRSLKTKITMLATCIIVITIISSAVVGVISINKLGDSSSEQILKLLCETGEKNLDSYFESVEQSVTTVAGIVSSDLEKTEISDLDEHIDRVRSAFNKAVLSTHGVFTYYYRIYPYIEGAPASAKGFWYTNESGDSFEEHEVTDLTIYNLDDTSDPGLVWFTVPKNKGQSI